MTKQFRLARFYDRHSSMIDVVFVGLATLVASAAVLATFGLLWFPVWELSEREILTIDVVLVAVIYVSQGAARRSTRRAVERYGYECERNPLVRFMFQRLGVRRVFISLSFVLVAVGVLILYTAVTVSGFGYTVLVLTPMATLLAVDGLRDVLNDRVNEYYRLLD